MDDEPTALVVAVPNQIGPYIFVGSIGEGSFSVVKLAKHEGTGRFYAIKVVPRLRLDTAYLRERFEAEIRIHRMMHHPGIIQLYNLLKDDTNYYVILEFCANGELFQYIVDHGHLSEGEGRRLTIQILHALGYVHRMGVTHRDLKPENLLLDENSYIKLSDFGLSRFIPQDGLVETPCGSPCYASPECLSGSKYNALTTDLWSLGVIVYAMLTAQLPWTTPDQNELFEQIRNGIYVIPEFLSKECVAFVKGLLTVSVSERFTISQALEHEWLAPVAAYRLRALIPSYVNLQKVDLFFDCEVVTDEIATETDLRRVGSSTPLSVEGTLTLITTTQDIPGQFHPMPVAWATSSAARAVGARGVVAPVLRRPVGNFPAARVAIQRPVTRKSPERLRALKT
jgi:serine/threonine protein kinase